MIEPCSNLGVHKSRATEFCTVTPNIFNIFPLTYKIGYQFICNKQKVLVEVGHVGVPVWNLLPVTLLAPRI
jgi:hypothetical protein